MYSTHLADLDLPTLPPEARQVHIVPDLSSHSLLALGPLCDAGCSVTFDATSVVVTLQNKPILHGCRTPATRLWHFNLPGAPSSAPASANAAIGSATPAQLVAFSHAALFSPALSTLAGALSKGYISGLPGLTSELLRRHPPASAPMVKGHLDQTRRNQRSTKAKLPSQIAELTDDAFPSSPPDHERTHLCYAAIMEPTGQIYSDQTGRFIAPSSKGNNYLLIVYDYDSNAILTEPLPSRSSSAILHGYQAVHARLCTAGLRPKLQRLDNECSEALKQFFRTEDIDYQLVPPGMHRRNAAERAIRTFKNHFIAGLCSVDKDFPLHLWDRLLPQAELTLNLLRGSRLNPKLSAWSQLHGTFDFNRTPIAPPHDNLLQYRIPLFYCGARKVRIVSCGQSLANL